MTKLAQISASIKLDLIVCFDVEIVQCKFQKMLHKKMRNLLFYLANQEYCKGEHNSFSIEHQVVDCTVY